MKPAGIIIDSSLSKLTKYIYTVNIALCFSKRKKIHTIVESISRVSKRKKGVFIAAILVLREETTLIKATISAI